MILIDPKAKKNVNILFLIWYGRLREYTRFVVVTMCIFLCETWKKSIEKNVTICELWILRGKNKTGRLYGVISTFCHLIGPFTSLHPLLSSQTYSLCISMIILRCTKKCIYSCSAGRDLSESVFCFRMYVTLGFNGFFFNRQLDRKMVT